MAAKKDYFGLDRLISLILAIIPFTAWICGAVTRLMEGKIVAAIVRFFLTFPVIWILDIYFMLTQKKICLLLDL